MSTLTSSFTYSIGKKLVMGLTGLFLVIFLVTHLAGNLTMFTGPLAFAKYAHFMGTNPLIRIAEIGLFAFIFLHIVDGLLLARQNRAARPVRYYKSSGANSSWFSRSMPVTGIVMLVFLILHLISFFLMGRFGIDVPIGQVDYQQFIFEHNLMTEDMAVSLKEYPHETDLYIKSLHHFGMVWYSAIYVLAMLFIGFHLNHGFQSAFQSLGINHSKYTPIIKGTGSLVAIVIPAAFAAIPIYFFIYLNS